MKSNVMLGAAALAFTVGLAASIATAQEPATLRIAIQEDPDQLDPARATTYGARVVFASLCDKLVDIAPDLSISPMLATSWEWGADNKSLTFTLREGVKFHDGTPFNAEAVKFNIERAKTLPESARKGELASVETVEVIDPLKVRLNLSAPNVALLVNLTDRAGMMISPSAAQKEGNTFGTQPVCSGPFSFTQRQQRDFIELTKFNDYWNASNIHYGKVIYTYIEDATVRLARLRAGDIDIAERIVPTDIDTVKQDPNLSLYAIPGLGTVHLHRGLKETPYTTDPRIREAFELAIDRNIINQVSNNNQYVVDNQLIPTSSPYHVKEFPFPARNVERAKELLKEAGQTNVSVEIMSANTLADTRTGQIIQSLAREAGFDVKLAPLEGATAIDRYIKGEFEIYIGNWSGRGDPDANVYLFVACDGSQNWGKFCNPDLDKLLIAARAKSDQQKRYDLYKQATQIIIDQRPTIPLYHATWLFGARKDVTGITLYPDGLLRPTGMKPAS